MRLPTSVIAFAFVSFVIASPTTNNDDKKILITNSVYADVFLKYKGKYDIVKLLAPVRLVDSEMLFGSDDVGTVTTVFFVEAEVQPDGSRIYQGLYVLKDGKAKKILEHGRDAAATTVNSKLVFFGAKDGLYVYNETTNSADKYGPITDSIIGIATTIEGDVIYILTEAYQVFKVWNNGESKEKIEQIINAKQIVLDYSNNLYFYSDDKVPYVYTAGGVMKIEGLPEHYSSVNLIKPPLHHFHSVPFVIDDNVYLIFENGSSALTNYEFKPLAKPTALALESVLIQYYAYDKKIYQYNIYKLILQPVEEEINKYLSDKTPEVRALATKLRYIHMHDES